MPQGYHDNYPVIIVRQGASRGSPPTTASPPAATPGCLSRCQATSRADPPVCNRWSMPSEPSPTNTPRTGSSTSGPWRASHRTCSRRNSAPRVGPPRSPQPNERRPSAPPASATARRCKSPRSASARTRVSSVAQVDNGLGDTDHASSSWRSRRALACAPAHLTRAGWRVSHKQARLWETHNQPKSHARTLAIKLPYALLDRQSSTAGHRSHVSICWRLTTGFRCHSVTRQPARKGGASRVPPSMPAVF